MRVFSMSLEKFNFNSKKSDIIVIISSNKKDISMDADVVDTV